MNTFKRFYTSPGTISLYGLLCFCVSVSFTSLGQTPSAGESRAAQKLSTSEAALVSGSKAAIVSTGISSSYFDKHFKLQRVIDKVADRRVIWTYVIGEYQTTLNDAIGFYTDEKGLRHDSHSIRDTLGKSHEIKSTISRKRADQLLINCLGNHTAGSVVYHAFGGKPRAALLLTASSIPKQPENSKDKGKLLIYTGFLNLETGKCTIGLAQAGRPRLMEK